MTIRLCSLFYLIVFFYMFSVKSEELMPLASELLSGLFMVLTRPGSEENEYVMKGIFFSNVIFIKKLSNVYLFFSCNEDILNVTRTCNSILKFTTA